MSSESIETRLLVYEPLIRSGESDDSLNETASLTYTKPLHQNERAIDVKRLSTYPARKALILIFILLVFLFLSTKSTCLFHLFDDISFVKEASNLDKAVSRLLSETPLIDGHNDLAYLIRALYKNKIYDKNFTDAFERGRMPYHVDLPRLRAGHVGGAFWSAFVPCPDDPLNFSQSNYAQATSQTLSQIDLIRRLTSSYPTIFSPPILSSRAALHAFHNPTHPLISPIGIEGLHQIGNSISLLRLYHALGAKYATLTHNCPNLYADSALLQRSPSEPVKIAPAIHNGLSPLGKRVVHEMNRMGMLIDLSHTSHATQLDVLGSGSGNSTNEFMGSKAPIMLSHSSAYALCPHPRNVQDDVLSLVKKTHSIVMVNFSPDFISCVPNPDDGEGLPTFYPPNSTFHQVARHVIYIGEKIGYEHVGLGSDFDGIESTPRGLEDVSKFPDLVKELLRMGVARRDVRRIVGGNVLRVWRAAEEVAEEMRKDGVLPMEDEIDDVDA